MAEFLIKDSADKKIVAMYVRNMEIKKLMHVTIEPYRPIRNKKQNDLLHVWVTQIARDYYLATGESYSPDAWKIFLKKQILGKRLIKTPDGEDEYEIISTRKLTKTEFARFLDDIQHYMFDQYNITLENRDDDTF